MGERQGVEELCECCKNRQLEKQRKILHVADLTLWHDKDDLQGSGHGHELRFVGGPDVIPGTYLSGGCGTTELFLHGVPDHAIPKVRPTEPPLKRLFRLTLEEIPWPEIEERFRR